LIGEKFCSYGEYNSNLKIGAVWCHNAKRTNNDSDWFQGTV
jgi:hypothetical protein